MARKRTRDEVLGTLIRASAYLRPYKLQLAGVFGLIVVVTLCSLSFPRIVGKIIDHATKPDGWPAIVPLLAAYAVILVLRSVAQMSRNYFIQENGMKVTCDLRVSIFAHLQKLSLKFYEERQTGRIVARVIDDSGAIHQLVTGASVTLISDVITAVGVFFWLFVLNWKLAIF